jgi:cathepsin L
MLALLAAFGSCHAFYMQHEEKSFLNWMRETKQFFTGDEYQARFGIWMTNARLVQEHQASFNVELNHFAALTPAEYQGLLGFKVRPQAGKAIKSNLEYDPTWDWRTHTPKVVNPIQDQGQCGSCWAFSAIQAAESADAIKKQPLLKFSESNIVDCVDTCYGCNGGLMDAAYTYVISKQGGKFMPEDIYPYQPRQGPCKFDASKAIGSISKFINVVQGDEEDLATKVQQYGPAAVAIDASHWSFQLYKSGIYDEPQCSSSQLDHGVGCLGWGAEGAKKYWIVRNSWGLVWGEQGYMKMIWKNNQCGIATMSCIPIP